MRKRTDGFSLVELMVVVLVIGIIVAVAVPVFRAARANAEKNTCLSFQRTWASVVEQARANDQEPAGSPETLTLSANQSVWWDVATSYLKSVPTCPTSKSPYWVYQAAAGAAGNGELVGCGAQSAYWTQGHQLPASTLWTPAKVFASTEQGVWYDPSDFSTMFQDAAGTVPVTAAGQYVGKILDKSGNGNHATQSVDARRPQLLQDASGSYYLSFNDPSLGASGQCMATSASVNFGATDKLTIVTGLRRLDDAEIGTVVELSPDFNSVNTGFAFFAPLWLSAPAPGQLPEVALGLCDVGRYNNGFVTVASSPSTSVFSVGVDRAPDSNDVYLMRENGVDKSIVRKNNSRINGYFGNHRLYIGSRGGSSLYFRGNIYALIIRGAQTSVGDISAAEAWVNSRTKAY